MSILVHYGGQFKPEGEWKSYVGGKIYTIEDFDSDKFGWLELLWHFTEFGLDDDFNVWEKLPGLSWPNGLVEIHSDKTVMEMLGHLDVNVNVELYIEHLEKGKGKKEMRPSYCKVDKGYSDMEEMFNVFTDMNDISFADEHAFEVGMKLPEVGDTNATIPDVYEEDVNEDRVNDSDYAPSHKTSDDDDSDDAVEKNDASQSASKGGRPKIHQKVEILAGEDCEPQGEIQSEYSDSESLHSIVDSDVDVTSSVHMSVFNEKKEMENPKLEVGMCFESPAQFRRLLRQYAIMKGVDLKYYKNEGTRIICKCSVSKCPFRVYGRRSSDGTNGC